MVPPPSISYECFLLGSRAQNKVNSVDCCGLSRKKVKKVLSL